MLSVATLDLIFGSYPIVGGFATRPEPLVVGCLDADNDVSVEAGRVTVVDAEVRFGECDLAVDPSVPPAEPTPPMAASGLRQNTLVGGRARLLLVSPLFAGRIEPVSEEVQTIVTNGDAGTWSWEIRPDAPGEYKLSLVLSILDSDDRIVEVQNQRVEITVQSVASSRYYIGVAWNSATDFLATLQGAVLAVASTLAAAVGLIATLRRKPRDEVDQVVESTKDGYL